MDLGTADAVTAVFFLKMKQDCAYHVLGVMFGGVSASTVLRWFDLVVDYVYVNAPVLRRSRNLSAPNNIIELLEEQHAATMRCTRFTASFLPTMREFERLNPHLGPQKLTGHSWDSRHLKTPHSSSFDFQRRTFSSKIQDNAIYKLACAGLDSVQRFIYCTAASISPANTDEGICSFIIDLETNQGLNLNSSYGLYPFNFVRYSRWFPSNALGCAWLFYGASL